MNRTKLKLVLAALALGPALAWAQGAGIAGTDHDFTAAGTEFPSTVPVGVCTYCHTPHKAINTLLLWNHTLSTNTFAWDVSKTTAGTDFPSFAGNTYKGPTAKCLSCHDGSVAVGDVAWFAGAARTGAANLSPTGGEAGTGKIPSDDKHSVGFGGAMAGNHPVAMPYPYLQARNTYNGNQTGSGAVLGEWQSDPSALATAKIRLFNDSGSGDISAGPVAARTGIECSSCHDPHNKATVDDRFLRGKLTGSTQGDGYLCLQCHIK